MRGAEQRDAGTCASDSDGDVWMDGGGISGEIWEELFMKQMRSGLCGMVAGAAWAAAILGAMYIGYSWIAPLCGSLAGSMTCAMVYYGEENNDAEIH